MSAVTVTHEIHLTPEELATAFWNMGSDEQADFYAALRRIAGHKLCMQTAWIVRELRDRADRGDTDAREGFLTLHGHAENYVKDGIEDRADTANRELARMGERARKALGIVV
jgi:hypothetical protein